MTFRSRIQIFISVLSGLLILCSCSSTTQTSRYDQERKEEKEEEINGVRFTSVDDSAKIAEDSELFTTYNPSNETEEDIIPIETTEFKDEFVAKYDRLKSINISFTNREKILFEIINFLDTPYEYGGTSNSGIDCSAFTQNVMSKSINLLLPRTAREQYLSGEFVKNVSELKFGDLVFFNTSKASYPGHVGIYLGENLFAHASTSQGVTVSNLTNSYYHKRFIGGRRINISQ